MPLSIDSIQFGGAYQPALLALATLTVMVLVQAFLGSVIGILKGGAAPGQPISGDYDDLTFRAKRTHMNSLEGYALFAVPVLMAVNVNVAEGLVNWLACLHVGARAFFWVAYYAKIGKNDGGPRSLIYMAGWATNLVLAIAVLLAFV